MPLHLKCRYDREGHGEFSNAIELRKHYDREHPEYIAPPPGTPGGANGQRGECSCGAPMLNTSFKKHLRDRHSNAPQYAWRPLRAAKVVKAPVTHPEARRPPIPEIVDVDDVVIPMIAALAHPGEMVPVAHLAALFAWRDATAAMMKAVRPVNGR